jgi:putative endonuclease
MKASHALMTGLSARRVWKSALSEHERARVAARVEGEPKGFMAPVTRPYFVYILVCSDGTLYVGSTSDVARREHAHNEGRGAKYTAGRKPVRVVYSEAHESRSAAQSREAQLKHWSREKKQALIEHDGQGLHAPSKRRRR